MVAALVILFDPRNHSIRAQATPARDPALHMQSAMLLVSPAHGIRRNRDRAHRRRESRTVPLLSQILIGHVPRLVARADPWLGTRARRLRCINGVSGPVGVPSSTSLGSVFRMAWERSPPHPATGQSPLTFVLVSRSTAGVEHETAAPCVRPAEGAGRRLAAVSMSKTLEVSSAQSTVYTFFSVLLLAAAASHRGVRRPGAARVRGPGGLDPGLWYVGGTLDPTPRRTAAPHLGDTHHRCSLVVLGVCGPTLVAVVLAAAISRAVRRVRRGASVSSITGARPAACHMRGST